MDTFQFFSDDPKVSIEIFGNQSENFENFEEFLGIVEDRSGGSEQVKKKTQKFLLFLMFSKDK